MANRLSLVTARDVGIVRGRVIDEEQGWLFELKEVLITPGTPKPDEAFTISGETSLLKIPFVLPCRVTYTVAETKEVKATVVGGKFEIKHPGIPDAGKYEMLLEFHPWLIETGLPAVDSYKATLTISDGVPNGVPNGVTECEIDTDCPSGYECVSGKCVLISPECAADADCPAGYECIGGECVQIIPEKATLYGVVIDGDTGIPMAGVSASANSSDAVTSQGGNYVLANLEGGKSYDCLWSKEGYQDYSASIYLRVGSRVERNVALGPLEVTPHITSIEPDVATYLGTIKIRGKNFDSGAWSVKSYYSKPPRFVSTLPKTASSTELTVDLSSSVTEGTWLVYVGVIKEKGGSELYSNRVGLLVRGI